MTLQTVNEKVSTYFKFPLVLSITNVLLFRKLNRDFKVIICSKNFIIFSIRMITLESRRIWFFCWKLKLTLLELAQNIHFFAGNGQSNEHNRLNLWKPSTQVTKLSKQQTQEILVEKWVVCFFSFFYLKNLIYE